MLVLLVACAPTHPSGDPLVRTAARLRASIPADWAHEEEDTWCRGGCLSFGTTPGAAWRRLDPEADALTWEAAEYPADGWGGRLYARLGAGEDWSLRLVHFADGHETDTLDAGHVYALTVAVTDITLPVDGTVPDELAHLDAATLSRRVGELYAAAESETRMGRVSRCSYGEYRGDSAVQCVPMALPAAELEPTARGLRAEADRHQTQLREDAAEVDALLRRLWPR